MKVEAKKLELNPQTNALVFGLMAVGLLSFVAGLLTDAPRIWRAYLLHHTLFMGFSIGAAFFLVVHYLSSSGWVVAVRRVVEAMTNYFLASIAFTVVLFFGLGKIYPWMDHAFMGSDHLLHHKEGYFSLGFFVIRALFFFAVVAFLSQKMICNSLSQDTEGGVERTNKQKTLSAIFLVTFAPLFTVFSVDFIKSLEPKWFSTMFGVYVFIGFVQASIAMMILIINMLRRHGYLSIVKDDHYHDLGKYMFGFTIFWAYIGVSQYLLIWYANIPEETTFYLAREVNGWLPVSIALPVVRFVLPFLLLLPRGAKRCSKYLGAVACLVIFGEWLDLNYLVMPTYFPQGFSVGWQDIGMFLGFLGFFAFFVRKFLAKNATVPVKDPYLHESVHHHVM